VHYIGIDLHKKTISLCVMSKGRKVLCEKVLRCDNEAGIIEFFGRWTPFRAVVEATASYEWFVQLIEPLAKRVILAHPKKLRVIAETKNKTDRIDARVLAEFLALDMIPQSYRPTPRLRAYRRLVRYRHFVRGRLTSVRCKIRHILSDYNLDRPNLFTAEGLEYLQGVEVSAADRWVLEQLVLQWQQHRSQVQVANKQLREFAKKAPLAEREDREVLRSIPMIGSVTLDVVLSELGDVRRFHSQKKAVAYAGLDPGVRASADRRKELHITKEGSRLLRWALVEAAWRLVVKSRYWGFRYERLKGRIGAKKAIVAMARRLLCVMVAMLQSGQRYRLSAA
jgi:transposase